MDRRDRRFEQPVINSRTNKLVVELEDDEGETTRHELPFAYEVCSTCSGKGTHVNPSIDSEGISAEDFAEDPDFEEAYFEGRYDVTCVECDGRRVTPVIDRDACSAEQKRVLDAIDEKAEADYSYESERAAERRMGY